jgi:hypothetical protein
MFAFEGRNAEPADRLTEEAVTELVLENSFERRSIVEIAEIVARTAKAAP